MSITGIKSEDNAALERRLEKHLTEISCKYLYGVLSGLCAHLGTYLALDRGEDKSLVAVCGSSPYKLSAGIVCLDVFAEDNIRSYGLIKSYSHLEEALLLASVKGKNTMVGNLRNSLGVLIVVHIYALGLGIGSL